MNFPWPAPTPFLFLLLTDPPVKFFGAPTFLCRATSGPTWKQLIENRMCEKGVLPITPTWQEGRWLSLAGGKVFNTQSFPCEAPAMGGGGTESGLLWELCRKLLLSGHLGTARAERGAVRISSVLGCDFFEKSEPEEARPLPVQVKKTRVRDLPQVTRELEARGRQDRDRLPIKAAARGRSHGVTSGIAVSTSFPPAPRPAPVSLVTRGGSPGGLPGAAPPPPSQQAGV